MAIVGAPLPLNQRVKLIHPKTGRAAEAQVVWRDTKPGTSGLAFFDKPDATFWNL